MPVAEPGSSRRFDDYDVVTLVTGDARSLYRDLTVSLERAWGERLRFLAAYTHSRTEDDLFGARDARPDGRYAPRLPEEGRQRWTWGTSDFDLPHRLQVVGEVTLPVPGSPSLSALYSHRSGYPFTPGFADGVDMSADGSGRNDPAFVDPAVTGMDELMASWSCLQESANDFAARNSCRAPGPAVARPAARLRAAAARRGGGTTLPGGARSGRGPGRLRGPGALPHRCRCADGGRTPPGRGRRGPHPPARQPALRHPDSRGAAQPAHPIRTRGGAVRGGMIRRGVLGGVTALTLALLTGCEDATGVVPAELEGEGTLLSLVFIDWNGDGRPGAGDRAAREVPVELQALHGRAVRTDTTDASGLAVFGAVPVGRYRVTVDTAALGDTLQLASADGDTAVTVARGDTAVAFVALEYPNLTTAEARAHPEGRRVVLHGTALTTGAAFGTTALHLADGEGAIRVIQAEATPAAIGDSVRVVGRTGVRAGQRVLLEAVAFHRGDGTLPPPDTLTTATAATAAGGDLDAGLARVERARILDAHLDGAGREVVTVDDGSGALRVVLHGNARLGGELVVGGFLDVTGVLVPEEGANRFRLWPRNARRPGPLVRGGHDRRGAGHGVGAHRVDRGHRPQRADRLQRRVHAHRRSHRVDPRDHRGADGRPGRRQRALHRQDRPGARAAGAHRGPAVGAGDRGGARRRDGDLRHRGRRRRWPPWTPRRCV
jgi:hypothetical protein